jgi:threonine dehydrogenase-like Zn-dependent dehydrogenase
VAGKNAVVIGQGSAGLFFDAFLRRMGAERVIGLDVKEARVAAGLALGATHTVNNLNGDALQKVEEITEGGLADLVVEAAGEVETINLAAHLAKVGGQLLYFGLARANSFDFDFWTFFRKYCHTTTSGESTFEPGAPSFRMALNLIAQGDIDVTPMLTHRFPFERVAEAYELARTREDGAIKAVIEMPGHQQEDRLLRFGP